MKKLILLILLILLISSNTAIYAYWADSINTTNTSSNANITIGTWSISYGLNLNLWEDEGNLNQTVPNDTIFTYDGNYYIVREGQTYNPAWHGLPGSGSNQWAYVAMDLEWLPNMNYRTNSVVTRNGLYYIANSAYNTKDWFIHDPAVTLNKPWSEWRRIAPISEEHFGYLPNSTLRDYANPDWNYIVYV